MLKIFYGHIVEVEMFKDMLLKEDIESFIKNEFEEASHAGFGSGLPGNADLYVHEDDYIKSENIINTYKKTTT